ncbi:hypothetical protein CRG98_025015 [Punica granatum]|uniref:Uncharacterized protein n=1 Tax=Punica granatum TaxID=22663 RepID=A0A2I0JE20_PUNGR|nr:hypothetical protein CRG98_025015 [Punica granatum]
MSRERPTLRWADKAKSTGLSYLSLSTVGIWARGVRPLLGPRKQIQLPSDLVSVSVFWCEFGTRRGGGEDTIVQMKEAVLWEVGGGREGGKW